MKSMVELKLKLHLSIENKLNIIFFIDDIMILIVYSLSLGWDTSWGEF